MRRNLKNSMLQRTIYNNHHNVLSYFLQRYIFFYTAKQKRLLHCKILIFEYKRIYKQ